MKKEYINPEMEVVRVETMTFLAESTLDVSEEESDHMDASRFFDNGGSEDW